MCSVDVADNVVGMFSGCGDYAICVVNSNTEYTWWMVDIVCVFCCKCL